MSAHLPFIAYVDAVEAVLESRHSLSLFDHRIDFAELDAAQQAGLAPAEVAAEIALRLHAEEV